MRRFAPIVSFVVASSLGCGGSQVSSATASTPLAAQTLPTIEGRAVLDVPIEQASPSARDLWERRHALEAIAAPRPLEHPTMEAVREWMQGQLVPWLRTTTEQLRAMQPSIHTLANGSAEEQAFASIVTTSAYDRVVRIVAAIPPPSVPEHQADVDSAWRDSIEGVLLPYFRIEVDAYRRCVAVAPRLPEAMRGWGDVCADRARTIDARLATASRPRASAAPAGRARNVPPECTGPTPIVVDPEAPAPDEHAPREIAVLVEDDRFHDAERSQLAAAVIARLRQRHVPRALPITEITRAESLRAQRRWTERGPVCGQAPPLPAVIAARHRNLVIASVGTICEPPDPSGSPGPTGANAEVCTLEVGFHRAGSSDDSGLPDPLTATSSGDRNNVASWTNAAAHLDVARTGHGYGYGGLGMAGQTYYRALGYDTTDPWLRVGMTLDSSDVETAMVACHAGRDVASYRLQWTISPTGGVSDASAEAITAPTESVDTERECIVRALTSAAFPCTRDGRPARVEARLCVGH
jgi:hypothetical protein